eukprot:4050138-Amphidinium_carterae.1
MPFITHEAFDSPGCTRAVTTTARRCRKAAASPVKDVMVIRSQAFPARVSQSFLRLKRLAL